MSNQQLSNRYNLVQLKPFSENDIQTVLDWAKDQTEDEFRIWAGYSSYHPHSLKENLEQSVKHAEENPAGFKIFKAVNAETNEMIGHCQLYIDRKNDLACIMRVLLDKRIRGKGLGISMIAVLLKHGFNELHLNLMELSVAEQNKTAINCYKKCGFVVEGLVRQRRKNNDGTYSSSYIMSILKSEYENQNELYI